MQGVATPGGPVLLCYDGSPAAGRAIGVAGDLLGGGTAIVATAWEPFERSLLTPISDAVSELSGFAEESDRVAEKLASAHAAQGTRIATEAGFDATPLVIQGRPRDVLLQVGRDHCARVIVLGSRGLGGVEAALLGSVSTAVLHHCRGIPVLVVPEAGAR